MSAADLEPVAESKIGRPPRELTQTERERLVGLAASGLSQDLASARLGLAPKTLRAIFKRDDEAFRLWTLGKAELATEVIGLLLTLARRKNTAAVIFASKCLAGLRETGPTEWGEEGAPAVAITFNVIGLDGNARPLHQVVDVEDANHE